VMGWDYPRHDAFLEERRVPSMVVRESGPSARVAAFSRSLRRD
jgi:hypothetical protein